MLETYWLIVVLILVLSLESVLPSNRSAVMLKMLEELQWLKGLRLVARKVLMNTN